MTDHLTDEAVKALVSRFPYPQQHRSGEPLLDMVYADPGNNGFYYREEKPDSVTCYVRIDHVARALLAARADTEAAVALALEEAVALINPHPEDAENDYCPHNVYLVAHPCEECAEARIRRLAPTVLAADPAVKALVDAAVAAERERCVAIAVRHWEGEPEDTIAMVAEIRVGMKPLTEYERKVAQMREDFPNGI